jgi:hypothetical protein
MQGQGDGSAAGQGIPSKKGSAGDYSRKQDLAQVAEIQAWDQTPLREQALPGQVQEATDPHSRSFSEKKEWQCGRRDASAQWLSIRSPILVHLSFITAPLQMALPVIGLRGSSTYPSNVSINPEPW